MYKILWCFSLPLPFASQIFIIYKRVKFKNTILHLINWPFLKCVQNLIRFFLYILFRNSFCFQICKGIHALFECYIQYIWNTLYFLYSEPVDSLSSSNHIWQQYPMHVMNKMDSDEKNKLARHSALTVIAEDCTWLNTITPLRVSEKRESNKARSVQRQYQPWWCEKMGCLSQIHHSKQFSIYHF